MRRGILGADTSAFVIANSASTTEFNVLAPDVL
jgi:hypothetical protein